MLYPIVCLCCLASWWILASNKLIYIKIVAHKNLLLFFSWYDSALFVFLMEIFVIALIVWHLNVGLATRSVVIITQKEIDKERKREREEMDGSIQPRGGWYSIACCGQAFIIPALHFYLSLSFLLNSNTKVRRMFFPFFSFMSYSRVSLSQRILKLVYFKFDSHVLAGKLQRCYIAVE